MLDGAIRPRELARWAHLAIGHGGAREAQTLVELDDAYDTAEYVSGAATVEDTDARVHAEAKQLLNRS
jgi:hypothetical protein